MGAKPAHDLPLEQVGSHQLAPVTHRAPVLVPGLLAQEDHVSPGEHLSVSLCQEELPLPAGLEEPPVVREVGQRPERKSGPLEGPGHQTVQHLNVDLGTRYRIHRHPSPPGQPDVVAGLGFERAQNCSFVRNDVDDYRRPRDLDVGGLAQPHRHECGAVVGGVRCLGLDLDTERVREEVTVSQEPAQLLRGGHTGALGRIPEPAQTADPAPEEQGRDAVGGIVLKQVHRSPPPGALELAPHPRLQHVAAIRVGLHQFVPPVDLRRRRHPHARGRALVVHARRRPRMRCGRADDLAISGTLYHFRLCAGRAG